MGIGFAPTFTKKSGMSMTSQKKLLQMTASRYRTLTLLTCFGMFFVLIAGVLVTNTDSGRGCGTDWPLCNGRFVPAYTVESLVEYTHRLTSGLVGLLVGATFLVTWFWKPAKRKENKLYAGGALLFTVMQAILGAMAVVWEQSSLVLALHFGISLFAFTCTWLLVSLVKRQNLSGADVTDQDKVVSPSDTQQRITLPKALFRSTVALIIYCYAVVYLGAYIRHTSSGGACEGWPLCNGEVIPELSGTVGIAFFHRIAALVLFILIALLVVYLKRSAGNHSELTSIANTALVLVVLQVLSGGLLAVTIMDEDVYIFTGLLHTIIISGLFTMLVLLAIRTKQLSQS